MQAAAVAPAPDHFHRQVATGIAACRADARRRETQLRLAANKRAAARRRRLRGRHEACASSAPHPRAMLPTLPSAETTERVRRQVVVAAMAREDGTVGQASWVSMFELALRCFNTGDSAEELTRQQWCKAIAATLRLRDPTSPSTPNVPDCDIWQVSTAPASRRSAPPPVRVWAAWSLSQLRLPAMMHVVPPRGPVRASPLAHAARCSKP